MATWQRAVQVRNTNVWHKELNELGYRDPLPPPIPGVQVVLCALRDDRLHKYIQEQDFHAMSQVDDEGRTAPLLLATLDLSDWTLLLNVSGTNPDAGMARLRCAHEKLAEILEKDELDIQSAENAIRAVEKALANSKWESKSHLQASKVEPEVSNPNDDHPLLSKIVLSSDEQAAIERYKESILASSESSVWSNNFRRFGKKCNIPFAAPRALEQLLVSTGHKAWALNCPSHLAPISVKMWQTWCRLSNEEVETCRKNAINNTGHIRNAVAIINAFPLNAFEINKCPNASVKVMTKQELPTGEGRREKYFQEFWNCGRPYLRCNCVTNTGLNDGACDGSVMWWDHAIWMIVNRLELFFGEEYPTLKSKLAAFWIWISTIGKVAVKSQLTFAFRRDLTIEGAMEYATNQTGPLLMSYGNALGARQIERYLKPVSFTLANPIFPPLMVGKRQKLNYTATFPLGGGAGRGAGRGGFNKSYQAQKPASPFEVHETKPTAEQLKSIDRKVNVKKSGNESSDAVPPLGPVKISFTTKLLIWGDDEVS